MSAIYIIIINETKWTIIRTYIFDDKLTLEESKEMSCPFSFYFFFFLFLFLFNT
jgi:hypothetical protein